MLRKKIILITVTGISLLIFADNALASRIVLRSHSRSRVVISQPIRRGFHERYRHRESIIISRPHRRVIVTRPFLEGFIRIGPPPAGVVVVERPPVKHIAVNLRPIITVPRPVVVPEPTTITVWINNSNGSQTSVTLTRSGPGYKGPRGEWYPQMPTQEQLSMVYGF
jgi:hypothetical protein